MIHVASLIVVARRLKRLFKRLIRDIIFEIALIVIGIWLASGISFSLVEHVDIWTGLYWALVTMATVGYGDVVPHTPIGRLIACLTIVAGIASFTAMVSIAAGRIVERAERRRMGYIRYRGKRHILVVGWSPAAEAAVRELRARGYRGDIVVVTDKPLVQIREAHIPGLTIVRGDCTRRETLLRANVREANMVVVAVDDDAKAVLVVLLVRSLNPKVKIVAEALHPESVELLHRAGADIVVATRYLGGRMLASALLEPGVAMIMEGFAAAAGEHRLWIRELPGEPLAGKKYIDALIELRKRGMTLVAIRRRGELIPNPDDDMVIQPDDILIAVIPLKPPRRRAAKAIGVKPVKPRKAGEKAIGQSPGREESSESGQQEAQKP